MFSDYLRKNVSKLSNCSSKKVGENCFWETLRNIAVEDIKQCAPQKVDSDIAIDMYYIILKENIHFLPEKFRETLKSNNQERFRVINRNMWSSNAFHTDGLANQKGIKAIKHINPDRKGSRITYQWEENANVNK